MSATALQAQEREFGTGAVLPPPELYDASPRQPLFRSALPLKADLTRFSPPPDNQGKQGSCTAWATTYAARTMLAAMERPGSAPSVYSPAYVFNYGKRIQAERFKSSLDCHAGLMIPIALEVLQNSGAASLAQFPYDQRTCDRLPSAADNAAAASAKIKGWATLTDRDAVRQALAQSRPVVFSMSVGDAFFDLKGPSTYTVTSRTPKDFLHAMTIVGYDDQRDGRGAFRVINSWSPKWGDNGYFWLSYDSFDALSTWDGRLQAYAVIPRQTTVLELAEQEGTVSPDAQLTAIREQMKCGDIRWTKDGSGYRVTGYVGSAEERATVTSAIRKVIPGASVAFELFRWPQCEIRRRLSKYAPGVDLALDVSREDAPVSAQQGLRAGDFFSVTAVVPSATPHLTIVYVQADGTAVPLYAGQPQPSADGRRVVKLGSGSQKFRVTGPFGPEAIVAVSSDRPLLAKLPTGGLVERQFIDLLNRELASVVSGGRPVAVNSVLLTTSQN